MKKTILLLISTIAFTTMFAQDNNGKGAELSIGVDGGLPMGDFSDGWSFGIGGTAKFAYNLNEMFAVTLQSGYMSFSGKTVDGDKAPTFNFIPIKAGARYTFNGGIYLEPQLGITAVSVTGASATDFTYAVNVGYRMTPGIDVSARYEGISNQGSISFIGFRVAYGFSLGKK